MIRSVLDKGKNWRELQASFRWQVPDTYNIAERCCDSWAATRPDQVAIVHHHDDGRDERWTYGQLKRASDGLAASLRARGITRGDRVAVLLPQCPEVMITHMAVMKLGAIVLPLFTLFGPDALQYRLGDSGARAIVTDGESLEKALTLQPGLPDLAEIYATSDARAPARDFWAEIETVSEFQAVETGAEDPACLIYTSGTTGDPKGVLHAHRFLIGHLPAIEAQYDGFVSSGAAGWTPADWAWIGGLMDLAMPCLYYGVPLISAPMRKFDPEAAFDLMRRSGVTAAFLPPTALKMMRQAGMPGALSLNAVFSGGESLGADLLDWGHDVLGAPINEGYGQTECNLVLGSGHGLMDVRPGSVGLPIPGKRVTIIDGDGNELPDGELGEIAVHRPEPVMFLEYWKKPEQTAAKFTDDWMRTGDLGRRDEDGYFWYESRDDDVITSAGYRIGPVEIEHCLVGHEDVLMAAVVGVSDPVRTEVVKAFVVCRDGVDWASLETALVARVKERISPHLAPRLMERVKSLPMTATGKIMRRALREG